MRIAAYQAPLLAPCSTETLGLIRRRVEQCEREGVEISCCPEAILGGLADHSDDPRAFAIPTSRIEVALSPLRSDTVTTIIGFTELTEAGRLYNSAAVCRQGTVIGVYRKLHPAIRRSVYDAGQEIRVFHMGSLTFGIVICYDSTFPEPARRMAALGATVLFVPTNNALPATRGGPEWVNLARDADIARASENGMWVVRADVAGRRGDLVADGSSGIVNPHGAVAHAAQELSEDLLVAEIEGASTQW